MTDSRSTSRGSGGRMQGKVVIVSGGARGMGAAHSKLLVAEGAKVVLTDLRDEQGSALAESLSASARFVRADATSPEDWARTVEVAREAFGTPTGLINNAGVLIPGYLETTTIEDFRRSTEVLQIGVFLGMKAVLPSMKESGGSIVNISSSAGIVAFREHFAYVAAKWAVRGMTKAAALELGSYGIRVNSIHPGDIDTEMIREFADSEAMVSAEEIPLGRIGRSEDVAALALFLLSDDSTYITGAEHVIDGGFTAQ